MMSLKHNRYSFSHLVIIPLCCGCVQAACMCVMCVYVCMRVYVCRCVGVYACMRVCVYVCMRICVYVCIVCIACMCVCDHPIYPPCIEIVG